jgi:acetylornithine deacetylase/succinyl-diaminopimelate desuccinylase-like protein
VGEVGYRMLDRTWARPTLDVHGIPGGTIPIVGDLDRNLGIPSVMMGFGLPDDNIHAPNEKFNLKNFELGIESIVRFLEEAGR